MSKKSIAILGAGISGSGAALLAKKMDLDVFVSDSGSISNEIKSVLEQNQIPYEQEGHSIEKILQYDEVMASPGIPDDSEIIQKLNEKNIPVISEIEFASRHTKGVIIGITGTNGKTTTTALTGHLLKAGGLNVSVVGNIGNSFARQVAENDTDYYVVEISSFHLDHVDRFKPHVSVLLNITPDHMDRYDNKFQNYIDSKFTITRNQDAADYFIYCSDDEVIVDQMKDKNISAQLIPFSLKKKFHFHPVYHREAEQLKTKIFI